VKRFHRKRKVPLQRETPVKITRKDVDIAAEGLLELFTVTPELESNPASEVPTFRFKYIYILFQGVNFRCAL